MEEHVDESFFTDDIIAQKIAQIELKKTGFENTFNERQIGSITKCIEPVSDQNPLETLVELFEQQPDLEAVPIEENNSVIGIIERKQVKDLTSSAFKRFLAKNCGRICKESSLNTKLKRLYGKSSIQGNRSFKRIRGETFHSSHE